MNNAVIDECSMLASILERVGDSDVAATRLTELLIEGVARGETVEWAVSVAKQFPHLIALLSAHLDEDCEAVANRAGVPETAVLGWVESLESAIKGQLAELRKVLFLHRSGWRLDLDVDQVFHDDPGNGTPALVTEPNGEVGTYHCVTDTGEVGYVQVPPAVARWLEGFAPIVALLESVEASAS